MCLCVCVRVCVSVHVSVCPCVRYFNIFHARKPHHQITISLLLPYWALLFVQVGILQGPGQHEYLGRSHWLDPFGWRRDLLGLAITTTLAGQPPHVPQLFVFASPRQTYYNEGVSKRGEPSCSRLSWVCSWRNLRQVLLQRQRRCFDQCQLRTSYFKHAVAWTKKRTAPASR